MSAGQREQATALNVRAAIRSGGAQFELKDLTRTIDGYSATFQMGMVTRRVGDRRGCGRGRATDAGSPRTDPEGPGGLREDDMRRPTGRDRKRIGRPA